jgi:hypothetical protein
VRYLVVLHGNSPIGKMYTAGHADAQFQSGESEPHPAIDCVQIDSDNPHYLYVERDLSWRGQKGDVLRLFIPHHAVVQIVAYGDRDKPPIGFKFERPAVE